MKILVLDAEKTGLPFAMRCQDAGHEVRLWLSPEKGGGRCEIGHGIVPKVADWKHSMRWADLVVMTDNTKYTQELKPFFRAGYPILGTTEEAAELEHDREVGQEAFAEAGIEVLPYKTFSNYDDAVAYVKKENKVFVSKPWGGHSDKNLSYVPDSPEDLVCRLLRWKKEKLKGDFMLQEKVDGYEMGVGAWFGPGGFSSVIEENWEHKKLMNDNLGPTTGEMGTVMRYVKRSRLFDEVLKPLEEELHRRNFVGSVDINCMVDEKSGTPWPLEFTCRLGWPAFNLAMAIHEGDPAEWMLDLLKGKDTLKASSDICVGVVMAMGDFPFDRDPPGRNDDWPIRGISSKTRPHLALSSVKMGVAPAMRGGRIQDVPGIVTAGSYVLVATGTGPTVEAARKDVYAAVDEIKWPPHQVYRTDIGCRLEDCLPKLHDLGYATGMRYK